MAIINTIDDAVFLSSLHERANLLVTKFAHIHFHSTCVIVPPPFSLVFLLCSAIFD